MSPAGSKELHDKSSAFAYASCKIINTYDLFLLLNLEKRELSRSLHMELSSQSIAFFDACLNRIIAMLVRESNGSSWTKPSKLLHGAIG
jgi:hypothetical protein